jgi:hypothetical protein
MKVSAALEGRLSLPDHEHVAIDGMGPVERIAAGMEVVGDFLPSTLKCSFDNYLA